MNGTLHFFVHEANSVDYIIDVSLRSIGYILMEPAQIRTCNGLDVGKFFLVYLQHPALCLLCATPGLPTSIHHLLMNSPAERQLHHCEKLLFLQRF